VVSYHKYKYFISFFNDYTSYAWCYGSSGP
jgi:hypothetical protein